MKTERIFVSVIKEDKINSEFGVDCSPPCGPTLEHFDQWEMVVRADSERMKFLWNLNEEDKEHVKEYITSSHASTESIAEGTTIVLPEDTKHKCDDGKDFTTLFSVGSDSKAITWEP